LSRTIEIYFDYRSPFAYFLSELIGDVERRHDALALWKPVDIDMLSNFAKGPPYSEVKRAYVVTDAVRTAQYHGLVLRTPQPMEVNSRLALRLALVARQHDAFDTFHHRVFRAAWQEQQDIGAEPVLVECIRAAGGEPAEWLARARSLDVEDRLREFANEAEERKVFGVPTMVFGGELFWGVDSLPQLEWRLAGSPKRGA